MLLLENIQQQGGAMWPDMKQLPPWRRLFSFNSMALFTSLFLAENFTTLKIMNVSVMVVVAGTF